jgi:hypothetical protein
MKLFEIEDIFGYILSFVDRSTLKSLILTSKEFNNFICKNGSFFTSIIWVSHEFWGKEIPNYVTYLWDYRYSDKRPNCKNYIGVPPYIKKRQELYDDYLNNVKNFNPDLSIFAFKPNYSKYKAEIDYNYISYDKFLSEDYSSLISYSNSRIGLFCYTKAKNKVFLKKIKESKYFISSKYAIFPKKRAELYFPDDLTKRFCEVLGLKEIVAMCDMDMAFCGSIILQMTTKNLDKFKDEYRNSDLDICIKNVWRDNDYYKKKIDKIEGIKFNYFNIDLDNHEEFNSMLANFHLSCVRALLCVYRDFESKKYKISSYALPSFFKTIETGYCENIKFFSKEKDDILKVLYKYFRRGVGFNFNKCDMKIFEKYLGETGHNEYEIVNLF